MRYALLMSLGFTIFAGTAMAGVQFTVVEHAVTDTTIHVAGHGDKFGNLLVFSDPVYNAANRIRVGRDQGFCIRVVVGRTYECFWTLILKGGQITSEGPNYDHGNSVMAVTGGTGRYAGAKGILILHPRNAKASAWDFTYELNGSAAVPYHPTVKFGGKIRRPQRRPRHLARDLPGGVRNTE